MSLVKKISLVICFLSVACMVACKADLLGVPVKKEVPFAQKRWKDSDLTSLQAGQKLFIGHCGKCHELYKPLQYSEDSWLDCLPEMAHKAHLNHDEQLLIQKFMLTRRAFLLRKQKK